MKKYRLLKDLPLARAGTIFEKANSTMCQCDGDLDVPLEFFGNKFDEWFEEIEEGWEPGFEEQYYAINMYGSVCPCTWKGDRFDKGAYGIGNCFKTEEEAERAVEKREALKRLRDHGFKFAEWKWTDSEPDEDCRLSITATIRPGDPDYYAEPWERDALNLLFEETDE